MSEYQVLARKFRPQRFRDVVAQGALVATLKNAMRMQRTAHAYLFCGCRGTGKTTLARLFAKALNCPDLSEEIEPCNACPSCREIAAGHAIDVLEIDGASHRGIEDIRQINETIGFAPIGKRFKIYLIDEVHMLTKEAFNALLKTLEEPPTHVKFFFCTTEPHKIPPTVLSRCQRFNLRRIPTDKMVAKLDQIASESGVVADQGALEILSEMSEGSLRDALSLLDQVIAFEKGKVTAQTVSEVLGLPSKEMLFSLAAAGVKHDLTAAFKIAEELFSSGKNVSYFIEELTAHFRTLLLLKNGVPPPEREKIQYEQAVVHYRMEQLIQILEFLTEGQQSIKSAPSERTALEMLLLKILRTHQQLSLESLVERLISLEKQFSISEDPSPKPDDLPKFSQPKLSTASVPIQPPAAPLSATALVAPIQEKSRAALPQSAPLALPIQEQSRFDTVIRFAAKELNGSLKKET
jgi:DNA polymerase-3 subunit gamma/tau